ncbi:acyltransferase family protein [Vibrio amylolyticus]|uniref:acyltransferase family protein n=1 Tax=Vibrio amylolyticus TaxID=2847292 RepID=UPI003550B7FD
MKNNRITWLDSSRGFAILLLIAVHYIGALESRNIISSDQLLLIQSVLRVATPYFIIVFGFTFFITQRKRINSFSDAFLSVYRMKNKLGYILIGRQIIVIINSQRYDAISENIFEILTFQQFSPTGEILTFYLLALILAPFSVAILNILPKKKFSIIFLIIYSASYLIGSGYSDSVDNSLFRLFFYDIYPFFPMFCLAMFGMLLGKLYINTSSNKTELMLFGCLAIFFILSGLIWLSIISEQPLYDLAKGRYKGPPHPIYVLIYTGLTIAINILLVAVLGIVGNKRLAEKPLSIIGRNTLLAYVLHYCLFLGTPISLAVFGKRESLYEAFGFIFVLLTIFVIIFYRDSMKAKNYARKME